MPLIQRGKVQDGKIVFAEPVALPEGSEVLVSIEPFAEPNRAPPAQQAEDFVSLPFFGMYANREDLEDSVAWVHRERQKWHHRAQRPD